MQAHAHQQLMHQQLMHQQQQATHPPPLAKRLALGSVLPRKRASTDEGPPKYKRARPAEQKVEGHSAQFEAGDKRRKPKKMLSKQSRASTGSPPSSSEHAPTSPNLRLTEERAADQAAKEAAELAADDVVGPAELVPEQAAEIPRDSMPHGSRRIVAAAAAGEEAEMADAGDEDTVAVLEARLKSGERGTPEEAGEAVSFEPAEHMSYDDFVVYSDEESQAPNEQQEQNKHSSEQVELPVLAMLDPYFARDSVPEEQGSVDETDLRPDDSEAVSEHGSREGTPPHGAKPEEIQMSDFLAPYAPDYSTWNPEDTSVNPNQLSPNSESSRLRRRLRITFPNQETLAEYGMTKESPTESLVSIMDILERYTLLEGHDLERARTIVTADA